MITLRLRHFLGILALLLPVLAFGQGSNDLVIPPATSATDFLNDRITTDITPTPNPNRVYVLQRNGIYFVNTSIRNTSWTFRMRAQDGAGRKPIIYLVRNTTTNTIPQFLDIRGNVWLKDLIIVGILEPAGAIADIPAGIMQTGAAGFDIVIDRCLLTQSRGQHIRTDQAARVIKVTNSVFTNMGDLGTSNFGAGKAVDIRGGSCDTLLFVNNTFVNFLDRIVRHRTSTASLNHFIFDHNTIVNGTSYHGTLALGVVGAEAVITNNLLFDTFALGNDSDAVRQSEFDESGEKDQYGKGRMTWVISVPNSATKWAVKNNYYTVSPAGQGFFDKYKAAGVTGEGSPLTYHINGKLGADSTKAFTKESLALGNIPKLMVNVMDWYRSPTGGKKSKNTPCACWSRVTDDYNRRGWQYFADTLDCKYPTTAKAYTGALKGYPAGDLNWYPDLKAKWEQGINLNELVIPPATSATDFLNDRITADVTPTPNPDRVYALQRNGIYFVNTSIRNTGWTFRMRAQDGAGRKPIIYLVRNTTTNTIPQFLDIRGNVWLKDLIIVGVLEPAGAIADIPAGLLQTGAAGFDIVIDNCLLTQSRGQHIRTDQAARVIKVTNSVFTNMGDLGTSNFGAGKAVDIRGGSCDTLLFVNNTFVNFLDRIVRHRTSTASLNHFIFDHNTIVNGTSYHGTLALGVVGADAVITNNLFFDTFALGNDSDAVRQSEFDESGEKDQYGKGRMTWVISVPNTTTKWAVKNNYYTVSPAGQGFFDKYKAAGVTGEGSPLTYHINGKLGLDSTKAFTKESLALGNIPKLMVNVMDWYRSPTGGKKSKNTPCACWSRVTDDYNRRGWQYFADTLDCKYATSAKAYTGAEKSYPAGDLNWYPALKAKWEKGLDLTGVKSNPTFVVTTYQLEQNYPNPFNPSTNISYALPKAAKVSLLIYNTFGQQVARLLDNQQQPAGKHTITWDGADHTGKALPTGMYFYRLRAGEGVILTRKMLLVK